MSRNDHDCVTKEVAAWWNENPCTFTDQTQVGFVDLGSLDLDFFENVERKFRKHAPQYQEPDKPLLSNYIDYDFIRDRRVLDIGTGTGFLAVELARQGGLITAIDITDWSVCAAKINFKVRNLPGEISRMDAQKMSFADNRFEFVSAHGCLMHMPDTFASIKEIYRVLASDGRHYAWFYHKGWFYWFNVLFLRGILMGYLPRYGFSAQRLTARFTDGSHKGGNPHTRFYSKSELFDMYNGAGFRNILVQVLYSPTNIDKWPLRKLPIGKFLPECLRRFIGEVAGFGVVVTAEK